LKIFVKQVHKPPVNELRINIGLYEGFILC